MSAEDVAHAFHDAAIHGESSLMSLMSVIYEKEIKARSSKKLFAPKDLNLDLSNSGTAFQQIATVFDEYIVNDPKFRELMEPVAKATLFRAKLDGRDTPTAEKITKQLEQWTNDKAPEHTTELWAMLFSHTFPAFRLVNFFKRSDIVDYAGKKDKKLWDDAAKVPDVKKIRADGATPDATARQAKTELHTKYLDAKAAYKKAVAEDAADASGSKKIALETARRAMVTAEAAYNTARLAVEDFAFTESALIDDLSFSLVLQELAQFKGLTPEELLRQKLQDRMTRPLSISDVMVPVLGDALNATAADSSSAGASRAAAPTTVTLRFKMDPVYERLVKSGVSAQVSGRRSIEIPATIDSVRGTIFLSDEYVNDDMKLLMARMSKKKNCLRGPAADAPIQVLKANMVTTKDGKRLDEKHPFLDKAVSVLAVYWLPGILMERTPIQRIMEAGKLSDAFKPALLSLVAYTTKEEGATKKMADMRMFFVSDKMRTSLTGKKTDIYRRISNGAELNPANVKAHMSGSFGDDSSDDEEDDEEDDAAFHDEQEFDDDDDDDDDDGSFGSTGRRRQHVHKQRVPSVFRMPAGKVGAVAGLEHMSPEEKTKVFTEPRVVEVGGLGSSKRRFAFLNPADKSKGQHLADGTLQSFAKAIATLYEFQVNNNKEDGSPDRTWITAENEHLKHVKYFAFVLLRGGHTLYRETSFRAEFDMFLTHGRFEEAATVFKYEKPKMNSDADPTVWIPPVRTNPSTLHH